MTKSLEQQLAAYQEYGYCIFDADAQLLAWVEASLEAARNSVTAVQNQQWFRHANTWFAGVNALPNDPFGRVKNGLPLQGRAARFLSEKLGADLGALDQAQVSVCYPGYPQPSDDESSTAFGYRLRRDAAHIDGLLRQKSKDGEEQQRHIKEHHGYILGIAMTEADPDAAPFVVWEGSHKLTCARFREMLNNIAPEDWQLKDISSGYKDLRREIFSKCRRRPIPLKPGQSIIAHRLILHGTAPWAETAQAGPDGRMICFFRPASLSPAQWLSLD